MRGIEPVDRTNPTPDRSWNVVRGTSRGAAVGISLWGIEELANAATNQPVLELVDLARLFPWYLGLPSLAALLTLLVSTRCRKEPMTHLLCVLAILASLMVGAKGAGLLEARSLPPWIGFGTTIAVVTGLTWAVLRMASQFWIAFLAFFGLMAMPAFLAVNLNAYGSPFSPEALAATSLVALVSAATALASLILLPNSWRSHRLVL
ncbi:MAG: hypothetical protein QGG40_13135, partial [Myxococcota bacterium]|nr:hypothetical protein [Myxococcota bacterium]